MLTNIVVVVFVVLALFYLPTFFHLAPYLSDAVFRARGSDALEFNVRVARERNTLAVLLLFPATLIMDRYHLYDPSFMSSLSSTWHLVVCFGVLSSYIILRAVIYFILKPKRRYDNYRLAHRAVFTFFIILMLLALPLAGILSFFGANDVIIKTVLYALIIVVYFLFLLRKAQILSLSCSGLRTFLYLCGLEIIPTTVLIVSAVIL